MSINDEFYSHFPSLNSNSKENQRYKRITRDYSDYLKNNLNRDSPKPTKQQQRTRRSRDNVSISTSSDVSNPSLDVIFSAEERNQFENEQKEERRKVYQETLKLQIEEQRLKKKKESERLKREEILLEKRLERQIESIRLQKDPQADQIVDRISLSENEKESYNDTLLTLHNAPPLSHPNNVYRYFSQSAKVDSDLFNYRKYSGDIAVDPDDNNAETKPEKSNQVALKKPAAKNMPKINTCHCMSECSRCHKKLEMFCKECNEQHYGASPEATNQLEIEFEPELPFTPNQQVVVYRASDQHTPYSFNIDTNSQFYKNMMEELREDSEAKIANYIKLYGDLRKTNKDAKKGDKKPTGTVQKRAPLVNKVSDKNIANNNNTSDIEDILNSAQLTVITTTGFAKKQLEMEKVKLSP